MRGKRAEKRILSPDPVYSSRLVTKLINRIMSSGKRGPAEKVVYQAFEKIKKDDKNPLEVFETAVRNVSPKMEVRSRRIGGASYQVPVEVRADRKESLALRWITSFSKSRPTSEYKSMVDKLAAEISDAAVGTGGSIKKRDDTHRMAEANKAFAHFRW